MDENIPPHCGEPNPLGEAFGSSTPAQYNSKGGVKSTSCPPGFLPDLTPVSKYLHSKRRVLTDVNSPEYVAIKDENFPEFSFDISTIDKSAVFNEDGILAEQIGSCCDLEDSSVSSVDTMENTMEGSVKLTNQTTTGPINDSVDCHPPGPSKCNVTVDADPTGKMVALNKTLDAEAELAVSEAEPCSNTIESKCNVTADADPTGKRVALNKTLDAEADPAELAVSEAEPCSNTTTGPMRVDPHNTFDMDGSTNLSNHQTTTGPMRVDPHNTFDMDGSTNLSNHQTTTGLISVNQQNTVDVDIPENETFDVHPPVPPHNPHNTFDMDGSTNLSNHQTTTSLISVNQQNTFDVDIPENETFDVHPPVPTTCTKDTTVDADVVPEDEPVVVVPEDQSVESLVTVSELEPVVAASEDEPVVAVPENQPVVAVPEDEPVVAVSEDQPVVSLVAVPEGEPVVSLVAVPEGEPVVAVSEDQPVVAVSEDQPVVAVSEDQPVVSLVAVPEGEPVVAVSEDQPVLSLVAVSENEPGLVAVTEDEPVVRAVSATPSGSSSVTGPGNSKDSTQSSTLSMSESYDSPAVNCAARTSKLDDTLELEQAQFTSTPMPHRYTAERVEENPTVVPRKLYQSHSQFVPATNSAESHSQFVPPTNLVSDRKTFMNPNDPRVKHLLPPSLLPPSASLIPGGNSKKPSGLPMMRRAQANGPGRTAALPKEATGIPRSVTEGKGIPKAMVTRSADTVAPAVGATLPAAVLRKRQGAGLPLATQRAGPALRTPTRRLAAKVPGEPAVHTNAAPAAPLLKIGHQSPKKRSLRSGGDSSGEAALLAKRKMDVQVPSSSAAGPSQTVKTGQSQTLKRPGSRRAVPGAKQKKMDCANCAELQKRLEEALQQLEEVQQENQRLRAV